MKKEDMAISAGIIFSLLSGILVMVITIMTILVMDIGFENSWPIAIPIGTIVSVILFPLWTIAWTIAWTLLRQDV